MIKTNRLPKEYQEVEYIESTGTQFIRTNYIPTQTTKIDLTFSIRSGALVYGMYPVLLGSQNDGGGVPCFNVFNDNGNTVNSRVGRNKVNNASSFITLSRETKHNIIVKFNNMILDNTSYSANTNVWGALTQPFSIFTRNSGTDIQEMEEKGLSSYVLYSLKFYEDTTLVKNYVPCYRKSDNVIGLYETIANEFFTNSGTGTFTKGADVGQTKIKKIMTKVNNTMKEVQYIKTKVNSNMVKVYDALPSNYQRVEYISATGSNAYVPTNFTPDNNTSVEIKFKANTYADNLWVYGARRSANNRMYGMILHNNSDTTPLDLVRVDYGTGYEADGAILFIDTDLDLTNNTITTFKDKEKLYINGNLVGSNNVQTFTCPVSMYLFTMHSQFGGNSSNMIIYYSKIWDNGTLIRHYIPCYRKSDNVIGMYDLVNEEFTASVGSFTKGPDV